MGFYDLTKTEREKLAGQIKNDISFNIREKKFTKIVSHFSNEDTYIRKTAYLATGKIFFERRDLQKNIMSVLDKLLKNQDFKTRQTTINATGEIGIKDFPIVENFFDKGLFDEHHSVRNAVIGSIKKMGNKNPKPVLAWAKKYLHHPDKEIRREICHGIELRGRTHPQDILPLLKELQHDKTARVKNTLVHVLGQIIYKENCLATVIDHLNSWDNKELKDRAIEEIIDVHDRYKDFAVKTQQQAIDYIHKYYNS